MKEIISPRGYAFLALPKKKTKFSTKFGFQTISIHSTENELPGEDERLLLAFFSLKTIEMKTRTALISLKEIESSLGKSLKNNPDWISNAVHRLITTHYTSTGESSHLNFSPLENVLLTKDDIEVTLSQSFFDELESLDVLFNLKVIRALKVSAPALNLYLFSAYQSHFIRANSLNKISIHIEEMNSLISDEQSRTLFKIRYEFKRWIEKINEAVSAVYKRQKLSLEMEGDSIVIYPGPTVSVNKSPVENFSRPLIRYLKTLDNETMIEMEIGRISALMSQGHNEETIINCIEFIQLYKVNGIIPKQIVRYLTKNIDTILKRMETKRERRELSM